MIYQIKKIRLVYAVLEGLRENAKTLIYQQFPVFTEPIPAKAGNKLIDFLQHQFVNH